MNPDVKSFALATFGWGFLVGVPLTLIGYDCIHSLTGAENQHTGGMVAGAIASAIVGAGLLVASTEVRARKES